MAVRLKTLDHPWVSAAAAFVGCAVLTFLFASAVSAVTRGSGHYRAAKYNTEQVIAINANPGQDVGGATSVALVTTPDIQTLAEGSGNLVGGNGKNGALVTVARPAQTADLFYRQIEGRANLFMAVRANDSLARARLAAQDLAAMISKNRKVQAIVLPPGFDDEPRAWRCAVTSGLKTGGLQPVYTVESSKASTNNSGCGRDVDSALFTTAYAAVGANSHNPLIFGGGEALIPRAIVGGAMIAGVSGAEWSKVVKSISTRANKEPLLFSALESRVLELGSWMSQLPSPGTRPNKTPPKPKKAKKKRRSTVRAPNSESGGKSIGKGKTVAPAPQTSPQPNQTPSQQPGPGSGGTSPSDQRQQTNPNQGGG